MSEQPTTWNVKEWNGFTNLHGGYVWTDGENIYYSSRSNQYVLDKTTSTWSAKTWNGFTNLYGLYVWTDGENVYYSSGSNQYVLDKTTSTWNVKEWNGFTNLDGCYIWTDGENIYYSDDEYSLQYVLDKTTFTWTVKEWNGFTNLDGRYIWTDGENIYYSNQSWEYVLDKATSTWNIKTWNGISDFGYFYGDYIWTDGENIYYSDGTEELVQYVLDKATSTWNIKTWDGIEDFNGNSVWTDGENVYYSAGPSDQYVLDLPIPPTPPSPNKVVFGDETLIDLTEDTATEESVLEGYTFHGADGKLRTGTATAGTADDPNKMDIDGKNADTSVTFQNSAFTIGSRGSSYDIGEGYDYEYLCFKYFPANLSYPSAIVNQNNIFIYDNSTAVYYVNPTTNEITNEESIPTALSGGIPILYNGYIYILGSRYNTSYYRYFYKRNSKGDYVSIGNLPFKFLSGSAVVYNNKIHLLGGSGDSSTYQRHYAWDGSLWTNVSTLPYSFNSGAAVVYDNKIHIFGGNNNTYVRTYHYAWDGSSWTSVSTLPYDFYNGSAVVYDGKIHILGGEGGTRKHYSWNGSTWTQESNLATPLYNAAFTVYNNKIYTFGGQGYPNNYDIWDGTSWIASLLRPPYFLYGPVFYYGDKFHTFAYTSTSNNATAPWLYSFDGNITWIKESDLPFNFDRKIHSAVRYNNKIHIFGGNGYTQHYSWNGSTWTQESNSPVSCNYSQFVVYDNKIHLLGGSSSGNTYHSAWDGSSWTNVSTLPYSFCYGAAITYNNKIHIFGGYTTDSNNKTIPYNHYVWNGSSWSKYPSLPSPMSSQYKWCSFIHNNKIYIVTGNGFMIWDDIKGWSTAYFSVSAFNLGYYDVYNNVIDHNDFIYSFYGKQISKITNEPTIVEVTNTKEKTIVHGNNCIATGNYSIASGLNSVAQGDHSLAKGISAKALNNLDNVFSGSQDKFTSLDMGIGSGDFTFGFSLFNNVINNSGVELDGRNGICGTIKGYNKTVIIKLANLGMYLFVAASYDGTDQYFGKIYGQVSYILVCGGFDGYDSSRSCPEVKYMQIGYTGSGFPAPGTGGTYVSGYAGPAVDISVPNSSSIAASQFTLIRLA